MERVASLWPGSRLREACTAPFAHRHPRERRVLRIGRFVPGGLGTYLRFGIVPHSFTLRLGRCDPLLLGRDCWHQPRARRVVVGSSRVIPERKEFQSRSIRANLRFCQGRTDLLELGSGDEVVRGEERQVGFDPRDEVRDQGTGGRDGSCHDEGKALDPSTQAWEGRERERERDSGLKNVRSNFRSESGPPDQLLSPRVPPCHTECRLDDAKDFCKEGVSSHPGRRRVDSLRNGADLRGEEFCYFLQKGVCYVRRS